MSTQETDVLTAIPSPNLFDLKFDKFKYVVTRMTGCWHLRMSWPFTRGNETYRACLRCGMRRGFDLEAWKSSGPFYAPSV